MNRVDVCTYIDAQFTQLLDAHLINEFTFSLLRYVEYDAHDGLSGPNGTVYFGMNFIASNGIPFSYECIEDVLGEIFPLDHHLLVFGVSLRIERGQRIDPVGLLGYPACDGSWVQPEKTSTSYHRDLGTSRDQYLDAIDFEFLDDFLL